MDLGLNSVVAVVTGASKGIGLACVRVLAREGARVVGISRSEANLLHARDILAAEGISITTYSADMSSGEAAGAVLDRIEREIGPIEVLINSAGAARRYAPEELGPAAFKQAIDAKYFSTVHAMEPVARRMAARGHGAIVNIVGQGGRQANVMHIAGGSANAALMLATVGFARAYASKGVRLNVINPGLTNTSRVQEGLQVASRATGQSTEELLAAETARIPAGRMAEPEEIAEMAAFLASQRASYVSGAIIPMDGCTSAVI